MRYIISLVVVMPTFTVACDGCGPPPGADAGPQAQRVVAINEVMSSNDTVLQDQDGDFDDWIELFNLTDARIELEGFSIDDGNGPKPFPAGASVPENGFLIIFADDVQGGTFDEPHVGFKLDADAGESLTLSNADGVVDTLAFPGLPPDASFGYSPDGEEDTEKRLLFATPGAPNDVEPAGEGEGEGECVPPATPTIVINEVLTANTSGLQDLEGNTEPWIELFNTSTTTPASLADLVIADRADMLVIDRLPSDGVIAPGDFFLIIADGDGPDGSGTFHTSSIDLSRNDAAVVLGDVCKNTIDAILLPPPEQQLDDVSIGLLPDGVGEPTTRSTPTPGDPNQ